jgi:Ser/Thr protein kinase RdoA (MazF antagonist)
VSSLERGGITEAHARRVAVRAAREHGVSAPVEPLAGGANHVFRAGDVLVRVAPQSADVAGQVALARWLASEGFPVPAPLADPEVLDGAQVSAWEFVSPDPHRPIDFEQLGDVVARLHRIAPGRLEDVVALPFCGDAEWLQVERLLDRAEAAGVVDAPGLAALRRAAAALGDWHEQARRAPPVVCHGDVHPHNVLMRGDQVVIVDWDAICLGPRAWDHAPLIPWAERYGGAPATYPHFARGYGADLRGSPLAQTLATVRLLAATLNIVVIAGAEPSLAGEARARVRYWMGDPHAPTWTPL